MKRHQTARRTIRLLAATTLCATACGSASAAQSVTLHATLTPEQLGQLVEVLGALGAWRSQLDAGENPDPRAALLFHDRLEILDRQLTQTGYPTAVRFSGGPPPSEWLA